MSRVINGAFGNANKAFGKLNSNQQLFQDRAMSVARTSGAAGAAILGPIALAANEAIKFEDAMAGVSKVLNLQNGSTGLKKVSTEVQNLSVYLAKTPEQVAELYANLAQGGAAQNELGRIAKIAGQVAVAFDIDPGIAADRFVKLRNAMALTTDQAKQASDAINYLSDKSAAKASQILDYFAAGAAGASRALNLTSQESAAIGTVFISMGKSGEEAATIVERMAKSLRNQGKAAGQAFKAGGGGITGLLAAIQKGSNLSGQNRFEYFHQFGEYGIEVEQLANNMDQLQKTLGLVSKSGNYAGSVQKEFANRSNTTAFKLQQARANAQVLAIELGTSLLPAIISITQAVAPVIINLTKWAQANPVVSSSIIKLAAGLGVALSAISLASYAVAAFNVVLAANPIVWIIGAIALYAAAVYTIYQNWTPIVAFFQKIWTQIREIFSNTITWIQGVGSIFYNAGVNIITSIGKGIWSAITYPVKAIEALVTKIREYLPFSPAKVGPLKTLHRVKIAETIASSIKMAPIQQAMGRAVSPIADGVGQFAGTGGNSSAAININFAPTVNIGPGGNSGDMLKALKQYEGELMRMIKEATRKEMRVSY
jgi:TP901 family phage tail tape measure protein